jgi:hypothetical protein
LIDAEEGDEFEILLGNTVRKARIEKITKKNNTINSTNPEQIKEPVLQSTHQTPYQLSLSNTKNTVTRINPVLNPEQFYDAKYLPVLQSYAIGIIDDIGPLTFKNLSEIIARAHGFQRTGSEIKKTVWGAIVKERRYSESPDGMTILWPQNIPPSQVAPFRGTTVNGAERKFEDIPYPEKFALALEIYTKQRASADVAGVMADRLGIVRLRQTTRKELEKLLDAAKVYLENTENRSG